MHNSLFSLPFLGFLISKKILLKMGKEDTHHGTQDVYNDYHKILIKQGENIEDHSSHSHLGHTQSTKSIEGIEPSPIYKLTEHTRLPRKAHFNSWIVRSLLLNTLWVISFQIVKKMHRRVALSKPSYVFSLQRSHVNLEEFPWW